MPTPSYPKSVAELVNILRTLPGIGPKAALRIVMALVKYPPSVREQLASAVHALGSEITRCQECLRYDDRYRMVEGRCRICADPRRDHTVLCVVAESTDSDRIEGSGTFTGRYHVLGGLIDPLEGITTDRLSINHLMARLSKDTTIQEVLFALNPTIQGEATLITLERLLKEQCRSANLTRLGRGLPSNSEIEYVDEVTMRAALKNREALMPGGATLRQL